MLLNNLCTKTDGYKLNHWNQYPQGTQAIYSYFESRNGAKYPQTTFFGLQQILKEDFLGHVVTQDNIDFAEDLCEHYLGSKDFFNREGFEYILKQHGGILPISIKAVPEGTPISVDNVLMTVENTDLTPECSWLTNFIESRLSHVWYPSTVATLSRHTKLMLKKWIEKTSCQQLQNILPYMLHDFGYRSGETHDASSIAGMAHLVNFLGTDTVTALESAMLYYNAGMKGLGSSVAATEHSVMTSLGMGGEEKLVGDILDRYPTGIISLVGDSYDIYNFVANIIPKYKDKILARDGKVVVRPDSPTPLHPFPPEQMTWITESLAHTFGYETNQKGYEVLNTKVGALWGDGIDLDGINSICQDVTDSGFSVDHLVFGMGSNLVQKLSRDTQRFAFKCSAQKRNNRWIDVAKDPLDKTKKSKCGKMKLVKNYDTNGNSVDKTICGNVTEDKDNRLVEVFRDGKLLVDYNFEDVRKNAELI